MSFIHAKKKWKESKTSINKIKLFTMNFCFFFGCLDLFRLSDCSWQLWHLLILPLRRIFQTFLEQKWYDKYGKPNKNIQTGLIEKRKHICHLYILFGMLLIKVYLRILQKIKMMFMKTKTSIPWVIQFLIEIFCGFTTNSS